ncbi:hypothetical protein [Streptomyces caatingaensis]|uniref:LigA protein n=1 Tax=Streptomyces caatingaensis TaxID=1678637 RepID=A0A0K9XB47_9ACTN|nr:hypothetical protein [Streptomyces caatingaensis]KNB49877.1 hypothetical protein AC230_24320 [Streptomyces caatingaensis]
MSDGATYRVTETHGNVHAGTGPQINITAAGLLTKTGGRTPRSVARDHLRWLRQRFVAPAGLGTARGHLLETGTALLGGEPGSGRHTAALMLLHELRDAGAFQELVPEERTPRLDPEYIAEGDRLLLDLSTSGVPLWADVLDELSGFRKTLEERSARLVVVLPRHLTHQLPPVFAPFTAELKRPTGAEVLRAHLRPDGIGPDTTNELPRELVAYLDKSPPLRDIATLAHYVLRARSGPNTHEGFASWCREALAAVTDRGRDVADLVASLDTGPRRALLLATAMLHGAHADAVHRATDALLTTVRHPDSATPLLERAGITERLKEVRAAMDRSGRVHFTGLGYAPSVRDHFWTNMPGLRDPLRTWAGGVVGLPELSPDDRDLVVHRFAGQCLRTGRPEDLTVLVRTWTGSAQDGLRLRAAAQALEHGLDDAAWGPYFRSRIYDWSLDRQLSPGLAKVLVGVCAEVMAVRHPNQALVRLHHLARREHGSSEAREALLRLVRADRGLRRRLLYRLAPDATRPGRPADIDLFLELVHEPSLFAMPDSHAPAQVREPGVRSALAAGWNAALLDRPRATWQAAVESWLLTAAEDAALGDLLLGVLVDAAGSRNDLLGLLYVIARDWATAAPDAPSRTRRGPVSDRLLEKIDLAQDM